MQLDAWLLDKPSFPVSIASHTVEEVFSFYSFPFYWLHFEYVEVLRIKCHVHIQSVWGFTILNNSQNVWQLWQFAKTKLNVTIFFIISIYFL